MRKFSASLLAISFFIFTLCGCQDVAEPVKPNTVFEATASVTTKDITLQARVVSVAADDISITLVSPESLKGLNYHKVNSTLYIEYNGLKCTTTDDYFTSYNPFEVIFDAVACAGFSKYKDKNGDEKLLRYIGETPHGSLELYVDKESGNIKKIDPSYTNCKIEFKYD